MVDATEPTCTKEGCQASYRNPVDSLYYEEETFETEIGDFTALCAWYAEGEAGFIPALGHNWQVTDDIHSCTQCGAEYQLTYYDYNASAHELEKKELPAETTVNIISDDADTFAAGWNIVAADVTFFDRIMLPQGDVKLILGNNKELIARRGINIAENSNLTIYAQSLDESVMGKLTIPSGGVEDYSAAIGSGYKSFVANITVNGGNIDATGGQCAPAIGSGGAWGGCGDITINGGKLKVTSGEQTAAIGSGDASSCGNILINGGDITAIGGTYSPGIGSSDQGSCGTITITGGHIISTGGYDGGSGIGSSRYGSCGHITIAGGTVVATAGNNGAGIGSSNNRGKCGDIVLAGGMITATGNNAPAIGKGGGGNCGTVTIDKHFVMKAGSTSGNATSVTTYSNQTYAQFNEPDVVAAVAPTCTTDGNKAAYKNAENGLYYEDKTFETEIGNFIALSAWLDDENKGFFPKLGHNWEVVDGNTHHCTRGDVETEDHVDENDDFICDVCLYDAEEAIKTAAKDRLTELVGENPSDAMKAVLAEACSKIDDAETPSGVEIEIENGEDAIALRSVKDAGRSLLTEEAGENPSGKMAALLAKMLDAVEAATTPSDVEIAVRKGIVCLHLEAAEIVYYDYNSTRNALERVLFANESIQEINDNEDAFVSGWNIVTANVTFEDRIVMPKNAKLIIANGVELTAEKGITVASDGWFAVYAQSLEEDKMGKLTVPASTIESGNAGIGTASKGNCGSITINGGKLTVQGGSNSAGIGSGDEGECNSIAINGGVIAVTGGENGAGIGSGRNGKCGVVNINGGVITAIGGGTRPGIGGGIYGDCGTVTIDNALSIYAGDTIDDVMHVLWYSEENCVMTGVGTITEGVSPTCQAPGHSEYIQNPVNKLYYDTAHYGKKIGDATALEAWLAEGGDGYLEIVDHQFEYIDKNTHQCIWCKKSESHTFDETEWCETCGSSGADTYYDYNEETGEFEAIPIPDNAVIMTDSSSALAGGYYVVRSTVYVDKRVVLSGDVHLILCGGALLITPMGITVPEKGSLTIYSTTTDVEQMGTLYAENEIIDFDESIEATYGACIGSENEGTCGSITINGGNLIAVNHAEYSAAIGSGYDGSCGSITINGGAVTANCNTYGGAGIGSSYYGSCGNITINGGVVNAIAGEDGVGIGCGYEGLCGTITINGGEVSATADHEYNTDDDGAGIGTGYYGECGDITVNGGVVDATGGEYGPGIGSGSNGHCGNIVINDGEVNTIGRAGIGAGYGASCKNITFNGGLITAFGQNGHAGIKGDKITIADNLLLFAGDNIENARYVDTYAEQPYAAIGYGVKTDKISPTCQMSGLRGYIQNPLTNLYYETEEDGGYVIGDSTVLEEWLAEGGDGYLYPIDHNFEYFDENSHRCTWCKTTENHSFSDGHRCEICGYSNDDTYYDYNEETEKFDVLSIPDDAIMMTDSSTTLAGGYYVVRNDLEIDERIVLTGNVHLILCGDVVLYAPKGITVPADGSLTVYTTSEERTNAEENEFEPCGGLCVCECEYPYFAYDDYCTSAAEPYSAGIGGTQGVDCGTITVDGGVVFSVGGTDAAGIGSGAQAACAGVVINGGFVCTNSGAHGASIGSGYNGTCGDIIVNGGIVYAYGINGGAGIGSGLGQDASCGNITVNNGIIDATATNGGAGIGSGKDASCGTITFHNGSIGAQSYPTDSDCEDDFDALLYGGGAGIGSGCDGTCGDILFDGGLYRHICGGQDYALYFKGGAGIGSGYNGTCGNITINGGIFGYSEDWNGVYGGAGAAGIGCGNGNASCGFITINLFKNGGCMQLITSNCYEWCEIPAIGSTPNGTCAGVDIFRSLYVMDPDDWNLLDDYTNYPWVAIYLPEEGEDIPAFANTCTMAGNKAAYANYEDGLYYEDATFETLIGNYDELCAWVTDMNGGFLPATGHTFVPGDDGNTHICTVCEYTEKHIDSDGNYICDICDWELLDDAKADAVDALKTAASNTPSDALTTILNDALANVEKAQTVAQVTAAKEAGLSAIAAQPAAEFAALKTAVKNALSATVGSTPSDAMTKILDNAKKTVDSAKTATEVYAAEQAGFAAIIAQITKEAADNRQALDEALKQAEQNIKDLQATIDKLTARILTDAKAAANTVLENAAGDELSDEMAKILADAKANVDKAKDVAGVNAAKEAGLSAIAKQLQAEGNEKALDIAKAAAIAALENVAGEEPSDAVKALLDAAVANVNNADSMEAVDAVKEAGIAAIEAQKASEQSTDDPGDKRIGDINDDGEVDMKDVLMMRKYLAGMDVEYNAENADCNADGSVDMKDVLLLRKYLAGLITELGA